MPVALPVMPTVQPFWLSCEAADAAAPCPPKPFRTSTVTLFHLTLPLWAVEPLPPPPPPPFAGGVGAVTGLVFGVVELVLVCDPTLDSAHRNASSASTSPPSASRRGVDAPPSREGIPWDWSRRANQSSRCSSVASSAWLVG